MSLPQDSSCARLLSKQLKEMQKGQVLGVCVGLDDKRPNLSEWHVSFMINDECKFYGGGIFRAILKFTPNYPYEPPTLTFRNPIPFHPNVGPEDGKLCISILHPAGEDEYGYELAAERWSPVQTPETILISVLSLFDDPNDESPQNVEAAMLLRAQRNGESKEFRKRVRACVEKSLEMLD